MSGSEYGGSCGSVVAAPPPGLPRSGTQDSLSALATQPVLSAAHSPSQGFAMNQLFKSMSQRGARFGAPPPTLGLGDGGAGAGGVTTERQRRARDGAAARSGDGLRRLQAVFDMFANDVGGHDKRTIPVAALREVVSLLHVDDLTSAEFDACVRDACHAGEGAPLPAGLDYPDFLNVVAMMSQHVPAEEYSAEKLFGMLGAPKGGDEDRVSDAQLAAVLGSMGLNVTEEQARLMASEATAARRHPSGDITLEDFDAIWSRRKTKTNKISNRGSTMSTADMATPP